MHQCTQCECGWPLAGGGAPVTQSDGAMRGMGVAWRAARCARERETCVTVCSYAGCSRAHTRGAVGCSGPATAASLDAHGSSGVSVGGCRAVCTSAPSASASGPWPAAARRPGEPHVARVNAHARRCPHVFACARCGAERITLTMLAGTTTHMSPASTLLPGPTPSPLV